MSDPNPSLDSLIAEGADRVSAGERPLFGDFVRAFLKATERERAVPAHALAALAADAFAVARERHRDELALAVGIPEDRPGHTVIVLVQPDRPFIVDSLRILLQRHGMRERLFLHPVIGLRRDAEGRLEGVDPAAAPESLVCVEAVPRLEDPAERAAFESGLRELMGEVRAVTDDHARMVREVRALGANVEFAGRFLEGGDARAAKICRFLDWLVDGRFVFLGLQRYRVTRSEGRLEAVLTSRTGLGIWRDDSHSVMREPLHDEEIPVEVRESLDDPRVVLIDKSRLDSRVHREGRLDRLVVKDFDERGTLQGFTIVGGLFAHRALRTPASQIPLLTERLEQILGEDGSAPGSHRHKAIVAAFDSAPVEFLLGSDLEGVSELIREIVQAEGSVDTRLVLRRPPSGRSYYAAVLVPRERYREELRNKLRTFFAARTGATYIDDRISFLEEEIAVLHFFCTAREALSELPDRGVLEVEVREIASTWEDLLRESLRERFGESRGEALAAAYETAFPEAYRVRTSGTDAARDVAALEALLETERPQVALYLDRGRAAGTTTLKIFLPEARLLSELLPMVDRFGIEVVDAQKATVQPGGRAELVVESFRIGPLGGNQEDLDLLTPRLAAALGAVLEGRAPNDSLDGLVLLAGLDWREVDLVRAYVEYLMQVQGTLTRPFVRSVLLENPLAVRLLVRLQAARLDPELDDAERTRRESWLREAFEAYRDRISSLNEDRALAGLYALIQATLRTNFFAPRSEPHRIAFKIDPAGVPELSGPRPFREIFVHSADLMGIHLRGGPVARGGLRWSDRADDLRVEILDLMRTQMIKNGIIVPVGAKGGFVLRRGGLTPREARTLADAQYRVFVASLLELTDNLAPDGQVIPPEAVHRCDADDPYLVVAADKGTAHLSDAANEIALEHDFWLGDAFASGGSEGYDHKKYGITARGAWECVKHHFAELGVDVENDVFTAAGIGDMSGDVFGNGMLLARRAKLLAAFDHRHLFLDPDPDPERSWQERKRLYEKPGSSWADYDPALISTGGGVFPRSAKGIELAPELRQRLGLTRQAPSGNDVVRAILALDVDLLWNGGIGTYVRASTETDVDVGDRANDPVRIAASELRARVVGEGGNLGFTSAARVEVALAGVKLNADAIDNSAGVDLSDHEVNYKILLAPTVRSGALSAGARHEALFGVAEIACESVLAHNRGQALAISLDELRSRHDLEGFARAIDVLCAPEDVDRDELDLPGPKTLARRASRKRGLTRPELAVLLGLAKLQTRQAFAVSPHAADPYLEPLFEGYFPESWRKAHPEELASHRLRREITALRVTNRLLDAGGVTLVPSLVAELGIDVPDVVAAVLWAEDVLEADVYRARLLDAASPTNRPAVYAALIELDRAVRGVTRFLVRSRCASLDGERMLRWRGGLGELRARMREFLTRGESQLAERRRGGLEQDGLPVELAVDLATLPLADRGLNIMRICDRLPVRPVEAAQVYARLGDATGMNWVYQQFPKATSRDLWDRMALADLRWDLLDLQRDLTEQVLAEKPQDPLAAVDAFLDAREQQLERVRSLQRRAGTELGPSALAVVVQRLRALRS